MERSDHTLAQLFTGHSREQLYERGDIIIRAGDTPSGIYLIIGGWVKVYGLCGNGETNIIMSLSAGDIFPLEWAVAGILRDVSFTALNPTSVLRIPRDRFLQSLKSSQLISEAALLKLARHFCKLSDELENLPYRSARERVAFRLVALAERFGETGSDRRTLSLRVPNEYIARSSNMTRETASREISWLARKNIIEHRNGRIVINDLLALKKESGKSEQS